MHLFRATLAGTGARHVETFNDQEYDTHHTQVTTDGFSSPSHFYYTRYLPS